MAAVFEEGKFKIPFTLTLCSYTVPSGQTFYLQNLIISGESHPYTSLYAYGGWAFLKVNGVEKRGLEDAVFTCTVSPMGSFAVDGNSGKGAMRGQPYLEGVANWLGLDLYDDGIPFSAGETIEIAFIPVPQTAYDYYSFGCDDPTHISYLGSIIGKTDKGARIHIDEKKTVPVPYPCWRYVIPDGKKLTVKNLFLGFTDTWSTTERLLGTATLLVNGRPIGCLEVKGMSGDQVYGASGTVPVAAGACSVNHFTYIRPFETGDNLVLYEGQSIGVGWYLSGISLSTLKSVNSLLFTTAWVKIALIGEMEDVGAGQEPPPQQGGGTVWLRRR
jgi:hypothetical protein